MKSYQQKCFVACPAGIRIILACVTKQRYQVCGRIFAGKYVLIIQGAH